MSEGQERYRVKASAAPLFGEPCPLHRPLLFGTLADHGVDYVALREGEEAELAIERTLENCSHLIEALLELDAKILIDPRRPAPLARRSHPKSLIAGEQRFDTAAGRIFLRDPDFLLGCPAYPELRDAALTRPLDGEVEARVASMRHLARIADPLAAPGEEEEKVGASEGAEGSAEGEGGATKISHSRR